MSFALLRIFFVALLGVMLYLALTPGPLRDIIPVSEQRHGLAFALLPLVSSIAWPRVSLWAQFIGYAVLGGAIELAQMWMQLGREGTIYDWLVDCTAAGATLFAVWIVRSLISRGNKAEEATGNA